jgi:trehalose 6-phosphate phosphatase
VADLFASAGLAALDALAREKTLYAFDFDGTLAPIVGHPAAAHASAAAESLLAELTRLAPTALVTGRGVDDVRRLIGFEPTYVIGNHGAEGLPREVAVADLDAHRRVAADWVRSWDAALASAGGSAAGIVVEPKAYSLSVHYRHAPDHEAAIDLIERITGALEPVPRVIGGKCVFNLLPEGAPDKGSAIAALVTHARCDAAFFIGDDLTDEAAFVNAPPAWVTVQVGCDDHSAARYCIDDQGDIERCLREIVGRVRRARA